MLGWGGGVSVNVKKDLKFFVKMQKKSGGWGSGTGEGRVWGDVRMDKWGGGGRASDGGGGVRVDVDKEVKFFCEK